ncbi:MAG: radical SAM/SPASM domain-containing protein [Verrucomicrobiota bacterium]
MKWKRLIEQIYSSPPFKPVWWAYYQLADWQFKKQWKEFSQAARADPNRPLLLQIEVSNICNANCTFCAYQYQTRPKKVMTFEIFKKVIDDFDALGGGKLILNPVVGESLVDKGFAEKVRYARSKKNITDIDLTSNGILLTREKFDELVEAGMNNFFLSISGLEREEYKRVYRTDKFDKIYKQLVEISASPLFSKIVFQLNLRTDSLLPQLAPAYRDLKKRGFQFNRAFAFSSWLGAIKTEDLTGWMFIKPTRGPKKVPCAFMLGSMGVFSDGKLTACSCQNFDANDELCVGNVMDQPLDAPWKSGKYAEFQQRFLDGNPPLPCKECLHYRPAY